jgi:ABC-2 type transport system ATP-binding protein
LHEQMTPTSYLDFFGRMYGLPAADRTRRIDELLRMFDLHAVAGQRMSEFSRGMQQKVGLARALLHEPTVIFLDEPTAGLDPLAARMVRDLIVGLKHASRSIVLCTHDLDEAERLADTVTILRHGRVVAADSPAGLRAGASRDTLVQVTLATACPRVAEIAAGVVGVLEPSVDTRADALGPTLTYRTAQPRTTNPQLIAELVAAGAAIVSVTGSTTTLEDVYASVLGSASAAPVGDGAPPHP